MKAGDEIQATYWNRQLGVVHAAHKRRLRMEFGDDEVLDEDEEEYYEDDEEEEEGGEADGSLSPHEREERRVDDERIRQIASKLVEMSDQGRHEPIEVGTFVYPQAVFTPPLPPDDGSRQEREPEVASPYFASRPSDSQSQWAAPPALLHQDESVDLRSAPELAPTEALPSPPPPPRPTLQADDHIAFEESSADEEEEEGEETGVRGLANGVGPSVFGAPPEEPTVEAEVIVLDSEDEEEENDGSGREEEENKARREASASSEPISYAGSSDEGEEVRDFSLSRFSLSRTFPIGTNHFASPLVVAGQRRRRSDSHRPHPSKPSSAFALHDRRRA